nr:hypothetical protein [Tanacetum cinerariifolium]
MARLLFCDYHNMVVILEKGEHNTDFHPMVGFLEASPLRYALTVKPIVYVSHLRQFWSTARIKTTKEGTKILAPVDGIVRTVSESSLRRNLKLRDKEGISYLPDAEFFENLTLMGYNISPNQKFTFQKDQDRATIAKSSTLPYDSAPRVTSSAVVEGSMQHTIPKLTAICTSLQRQLSELTDKFQAQEVEINRLNERVKLLEEREGVDATNSRYDAPIKGRSMDEGEAVAERVSDDTEEMATKKKRKGSHGREDQRRVKQIARDAEIERIHAEEELQSMIDDLDSNNETVAKYLEENRRFSSELPMERRIELISDLVKYQDNYTKVYKFQIQQRKSWTKKQKRDYYMAVIKNNLDWKVKDFKGMTFKEVEAKFNSVWKQMEDFIPMGSKEEAERIKRKGINLKQESAKKQKSSEEITEEAKSPKEVPEEKIKEMMQLVPIEEVYVEALQVKHPIIDWKVHTNDLLKHLDRDNLNQLWSLVKETLSKKPATSDKEMELWVELSRLYEPNVEDQLWTHTQNFMHAPAEWKLYDKCGVHQLTSKDKDIFILVDNDYPLRKGLALVMISYKLQVENYSQMADDLVRKIYNIANSPRQQVKLVPTARRNVKPLPGRLHCYAKSRRN